MVLNIVLILLGVISLVFGVKNKLKVWIVIGLILLGCGVVSACVDYATMGVEDSANPNARLPFVLDHFM